MRTIRLEGHLRYAGPDEEPYDCMKLYLDNETLVTLLGD